MGSEIICGGEMMSSADYQLGKLKTALVKLNEALDCFEPIPLDRTEMLEYVVRNVKEARDSLEADIETIEFWRGEGDD